MHHVKYLPLNVWWHDMANNKTELHNIEKKLLSPSNSHSSFNVAEIRLLSFSIVKGTSSQTPSEIHSRWISRNTAWERFPAQSQQQHSGLFPLLTTEMGRCYKAHHLGQLGRSFWLLKRSTKHIIPMIGCSFASYPSEITSGYKPKLRTGLEYRGFIWLSPHLPNVRARYP